MLIKILKNNQLLNKDEGQMIWLINKAFKWNYVYTVL